MPDRRATRLTLDDLPRDIQDALIWEACEDIVRGCHRRPIRVPWLRLARWVISRAGGGTIL